MKFGNVDETDEDEVNEYETESGDEDEDEEGEDEESEEEEEEDEDESEDESEDAMDTEDLCDDDTSASSSPGSVVSVCLCVFGLVWFLSAFLHGCACRRARAPSAGATGWRRLWLRRA
eukprot:2601962-Rhodomonas_salina.1